MVQESEFITGCIEVVVWLVLTNWEKFYKIHLPCEEGYMENQHDLPQTKHHYYEWFS